MPVATERVSEYSMSFKVCTCLESNPAFGPRLAVDTSVTWQTGQIISIGFIGGTDYQQHKVMEIASQWLHYANLYFEWRSMTDVYKPIVRIAFQRGKGSWSYLGRDALMIQRNKPTMNFGWLDESTPPDEWDRVVLHEFGHMLGCIHEHQSPAAGIKWDKPLLYQYYWETQGWSKEQVNNNIIAKYDQDISNTEFDSESIMLYPVEQRFTLDDFEVGWNRQLSDTDKGFIAEVYP